MWSWQGPGEEILTEPSTVRGRVWGQGECAGNTVAPTRGCMEGGNCWGREPDPKPSGTPRRYHRDVPCLPALGPVCSAGGGGRLKAYWEGALQSQLSPLQDERTKVTGTGD